ncbi:MAG TPA: protein kinase [Kofleriaceae bacterium]|nr:protein kinase [Kofleriaceae bacterium]
MVDRALDPEEAERIAAHLDDCDACREIVVAAVHGAAPTPATVVAMGTPTVARQRARVGERVGRYRVRALLGAGGMGQVYDAYDAELDRAIALKILRPELAGGAAALTERLVRESRLMAKVRHPSVITVHDVGRDGDAVFIAMELVRGETLASYVARARPGWREVVRLATRAGEGLAAAHAAGVIHRDFKPDNVLVELDAERRATRVVVTDFGIARATGERDAAGSPRDPRDVRLTATGVALGTPAYMAPEQLAGKDVDARADVFAFAVSVWEAVFGVRPFAGKTVAEIRAAMTRRPRPPDARAPARLVRVLERGLAIEPAERWPDMRAMVGQLARLGTRRRRLALAAGALGLVGVGIAGALAIARPAGEDDPCAAAVRAFDRDAGPARLDALRTAMAPAEPRIRDAVLAMVANSANRWRMTQIQTCRAGAAPIQSTATAACLDARHVELAGFVDDVIADGSTYASSLGGVVGDPVRCVAAPPGLLAPRVPAEPALRRRVTAVRYKLFAAEAAREAADFKTALAAIPPLVEQAKQLWPPLHAEAMYLLGTTQSLGGDVREAGETLRATAALAEASHSDYIAANAWIQLVLSATIDDGQPGHGLEYVDYAEAALERLGRPPDVEVLFQYAKGGALADLGRRADAEAALRRSVEIAETEEPDYIPMAIQGLGYFYELDGRYGDAVGAYRDALARSLGAGNDPVAEMAFREQLARDLSMAGHQAEALVHARRAVELADKLEAPDSQEVPVAHATLSNVLENDGQFDAALVEIRGAADALLRISGERNPRYAEALQAEAELLALVGRAREGEPMIRRACEILDFQAETSPNLPECQVTAGFVLDRLGRSKEAVAAYDRARPPLVKLLGEHHPLVGVTWLDRAIADDHLGDRAAAIADLERALPILKPAQLDIGFVADAERLLAKQLWPSDPTRARALLDDALVRFSAASTYWTRERAEAIAFQHGVRH